jgi:hypothetical protein
MASKSKLSRLQHGWARLSWISFFPHHLLAKVSKPLLLYLKKTKKEKDKSTPYSMALFEGLNRLMLIKHMQVLVK